MSARTVTVAVGSSLLVDGELARVVEFDGRTVTVGLSEGRYSSMAVAELVRRARAVDPVADGDGDDPGLVLAGVAAAEGEQVAQRDADVRAVVTGCACGHAELARPGEPRPAF